MGVDLQEYRVVLRDSLTSQEKKQVNALEKRLLWKVEKYGRAYITGSKGLYLMRGNEVFGGIRFDSNGEIKQIVALQDKNFYKKYGIPPGEELVRQALYSLKIKQLAYKPAPEFLTKQGRTFVNRLIDFNILDIELKPDRKTKKIIVKPEEGSLHLFAPKLEAPKPIAQK